MPRLGYRTRIAHSQEVTWGNAVARDGSLRVTRHNIERKVAKKKLPVLAHATTSLAQSMHYTASDKVMGSMTAVFQLEGMGRFLEMAFRKAVATTGSNPYDHVYMLGLASRSMTLELVDWDHATAAEIAEVAEGCVCTGWTLEGRVGEPLTMTLNIVGQTTGGETTATAIGSAPYTTNGAPVLFHQATTKFTWNASAAALVRSFRITVDHKLLIEEDFGSTNPVEPIPNDHAAITVELDLRWESAVYSAGMTSGTVADASMVFTVGSSLLTINLESCYVDDVSTDRSTPGVISQRARLVAQSDGTTEAVKFTVRNTQTSGVAV